MHQRARDAGLVGDPVPDRDFVLGNAVLWQRDEPVGIFAVQGVFKFVCGQRRELRVQENAHTGEAAASVNYASNGVIRDRI